MRPFHPHPPGPEFPERGWIQFLILRILYESPMHGYQLINELETRGYLAPRRIQSGAIYTILRRMEARGLLRSAWERKGSRPDRRTYHVTQSGEDALKRGLEVLIERKALLDELAEFYRNTFGRREVDQGHTPESGTTEEKGGEEE